MGMVDIIASDSDDRKVFFLQKKKKIQWRSRRIAADNKTCYLGECLQKTCFRHISAISQKSIPITPQSQH